MGLAGGCLAEPHRPHGLIHVGDSNHAGTRVGETVEGVVGGDPEFPGLAENGPGHDPLPVAVGVAPIHRDGVHLGEAGPIVGAHVNRHGISINPLAGIGGVKGGRAGPVRGHHGSAGKSPAGCPATAEGGGVGRGPVAAIR